MEGKLYKYKNFIRGWKDRYFVLKGCLLYYYHSKGDKPRGRIHLGLSQIITEDNEGKTFQINTGSKIFYLKAETNKEKENWIIHLKKGKLEGEKQIKNANNFININDINKQSLNNIDGEKIKDIHTKLNLDNELFQNLLNKNDVNKDKLSIILNRYKETTNELNELIQNETFIISNNDKEIVLKDNNGIIMKMNQPEARKHQNNINNDQNLIKDGYMKYNNTSNDLNNNNGNNNIININNGNNNNINNNNIENNNNNNEKNKISSLMISNEEFFDCDDSDEFSDINIKGQKSFVNNNSSKSNNIIENNNNKELTFRKKEENGKKFYDPLYDYPKRKTLPFPKKNIGLNVWSVFKSAVGKDLNRFAVPVFFNEPISSLQKFVEFFQYSYLLNNAANCDNPFLRIAYCACFCIGEFVMNNARQSKFFNPLLFETYEYIDIENDVRIFCEQVSHHPAISACYAEGNGWDFYSNTNAILKFFISGKLEANAIGKTYINFFNFNDKIYFTKPKAMIRNLILGTIDIDVEGKFEVANEEGDICEVECIPSTSGKKGQIKGVIRDVNGNEQYTLGGNWLENLYVINSKTNEKNVLWTIIPSLNKDNYYFQPFTTDLNNLTEEMKTALPPTDSRFRPDQRLMEEQKIEEASDEKHRLEEKQRATAKKNKKEGIIPKPRYFEETYDDLTGELIYKYKGGYWEDRKNKNFKDFPDIF